MVVGPTQVVLVIGDGYGLHGGGVGVLAGGVDRIRSTQGGQEQLFLGLTLLLFPSLSSSCLSVHHLKPVFTSENE